MLSQAFLMHGAYKIGEKMSFIRPASQKLIRRIIKAHGEIKECRISDGVSLMLLLGCKLDGQVLETGRIQCCLCPVFFELENLGR